MYNLIEKTVPYSFWILHGTSFMSLIDSKQNVPENPELQKCHRVYSFHWSNALNSQGIFHLVVGIITAYANKFEAI